MNNLHALYCRIRSFLKFRLPLSLNGLCVVKIILLSTLGLLLIDSNSIAQTPEENYVLLYSTLGYESRGSKRALIKTIESIDPNLISDSKSQWHLVDNTMTSIKSGRIKFLGVTFGDQLWEADFTSFQLPGYYLLEVTLSDPDGNILANLNSLEFEIEEQIYSKRIVSAIAVNNGIDRRAPVEYGGGYFDCNTKIGEAYSHGIYLSGLVNTYVRRQDNLSAFDKLSIIENAAIAVDYLFELHDPNTGEIANQHPSRPGNNEGPFNTEEGLYGLVKYVHYFNNIDPVRANAAYTKCLMSINYLDNIGWYNDLKSIVYYDLYKYSGDLNFKDKAIEALNTFLYYFNLRNRYRNPWRAVPYFEGLYYIYKEFPAHPDYPSWVGAAQHIQETYYKYVQMNNGYNCVPQGSGPPEWDDMAFVPQGMGTQKFYANSHFGSTLLDSIYLAEVTGTYCLEKISAGSAGWLTGLNPGIAGHRTNNPEASDTIVSAAFIMNLDARYAKPWSWWEWSGLSAGSMSIMNGFIIENGMWAYPDRWYSGETFIKHDGVFLNALTAYEDFIFDHGPTGCEIDLERDFDVDGAEVAAIASSYGPNCNGDCFSDVNCDGAINAHELALLAQNFGKSNCSLP